MTVRLQSFFVLASFTLGACGCGGASDGSPRPPVAPAADAADSRDATPHVRNEEEALRAEIDPRTRSDDPERVARALYRLALLLEGRAATRWQPDDLSMPTARASASDEPVALLHRLLSEHPRARAVGDALLLLGEIEHTRHNEDAALRAWTAVVCAERAADPVAAPAPATSAVPWAGERSFDACTPRTDDSAIRAHAWIRIGELAFDATPGLDLAVAIEAYRRTLAEPGVTYELVAIARYKRAWSFYRADRYAEALVEFAAVANDDRGRAVLRRDGIQYMAITIVERDWNGDGRDDALFGLDRPEASAWLEPTFPHAAEVLRQVAQILVDETRYPEALRAYDLLFARFPTASTADDRARREQAAARATPGRATIRP